MGRGEEGFTLIEVMITVAIIGIATALAVPNYLDWQARSQLRQATEEVAMQLNLARMAAMQRNRTVNVTLQSTGNGIAISGATASSNVSLVNSTIGWKGMSLNGGTTTVSFSSLGLRTSAGTGIQTLGVCNAKKVQQIVNIYPAGKVDWSATPSTTLCP